MTMSPTAPDGAPIHALLNRIVGITWTAYAQHTAHVALLESWGIAGLAHTMREHIRDEPATIEAALSRLLEIDGAPAFAIEPIKVGRNLREVLQNDMERQRHAPGLLNEAAELAASSHDATTRRLVETILADEEEHLDWLRTELELLDRLGEALYVANRLLPSSPGTS